MLKHLLFTPIFLGLISCSTYQNTSVAVKDAIDRGKVKVITNSGNEVKLENIIYEDSAIIGVKDSTKIPIDTGQVQSIHLAYTNKTILNKNSLCGTLALISLSINYERVIVTDDFFNLLLKASAGKFYIPKTWGSPAISGPQFLFQFIFLHGRASNFLEYGIGLGSWYQKTEYNKDEQSYEIGYLYPAPIKKDYLNFFPAVNFGYRYQRSNFSPVFRVGIGFPEILYLSGGFSF